VQARAVIDALLSTDTTLSAFRVLAVTRNLRSADAMDLAMRYPKNILTVVEADLASPESVRKLFINEKAAMAGEAVWGVYSVAPCSIASKPKEEERQGKMMVDLAREFGVSVFIYSSSQLVQNSFDDPNYECEFFAGKVAVERYIQSLDERSLGWITLRPGFFMEAFAGKPAPYVVGIFTAGLKPESKVHMTLAEDIGRAAAELFQNPGAYIHRVVPLVSDSLTMPEICEAYKRATSRDLPTTYSFTSKAILTFISSMRYFVQGIARMDQASGSPPVKLPISTTSFEAWAASLK